MRVLVTTEHHFQRDEQGNTLPRPPSLVDYAFWQRYLAVFDEVAVLARVSSASRPEADLPRASGPGVEFYDLPDYTGPWQYLASRARIRAAVRAAVQNCDAFILRVPGIIGTLVWKQIRGRRPFAVEVVGDPWDSLSPGAVRSIARPVARHILTKNLRAMCREAVAASYVTRAALQKKYPPAANAWTTHASSIELKDGIAPWSQIEDRIRRIGLLHTTSNLREKYFQLGFVGTFNQLYKAPDVLLTAFAACRREFPGLELAMVGGGAYLEPMRQLAERLEISGSVRFAGVIKPGEAVYRFLDEVDLFVLPSRQEGLPRAMIEAMARGCPCIGSLVGGFPELVPGEDLVPPGDAGALAEKILEVLRSPERMHVMARRNWEAAKEYASDVLTERRLEFYRTVREASRAAAGKG